MLLNWFELSKHCLLLIIKKNMISKRSPPKLAVQTSVYRYSLEVEQKDRYSKADNQHCQVSPILTLV